MAVATKNQNEFKSLLTLFTELMEKLEIEKESLKARLEIDERSDGVISSQSARGAPTVAALGCSIPFCSLRNFKTISNLSTWNGRSKYFSIIAELLSKG